MIRIIYYTHKRKQRRRHLLVGHMFGTLKKQTDSLDSARDGVLVVEGEGFPESLLIPDEGTYPECFAPVYRELLGGGWS